MIEYFKNAFKALSIVLMGSLVAAGYTGAVALAGLTSMGVVAVFTNLAIIVGLGWSVAGGIYVPWVFARTWAIWQKLEVLAYNAELPIEQRVQVEVISPIA